MKSIVLIGMPGAGKSTIGKLLSDKLNLAFVDTDRLIEHEIKQSIQNYLDVNGYLKLRSIEEKVILREDIKNKVIATGWKCSLFRTEHESPRGKSKNYLLKR